jgi:hypothetical protein
MTEFVLAVLAQALSALAVAFVMRLLRGDERASFQPAA